MKKNPFQFGFSVIIPLFLFCILLKPTIAGGQTTGTASAGDTASRTTVSSPGEITEPVIDEPAGTSGPGVNGTPAEKYKRGESAAMVWNHLTRLWEPPAGEGDSFLPNTASNCANSDFAQGNFNLWKGCYGTWCDSASANNTRCSVPYTFFKPPCNNANMPWSNTPTGGHFQIITAPGSADAFVPAINSIFPGESYTCLLGNHQTNNGGGYVDQLKYTMTMGTDNQFFIYRYAIVLANITDATHNTPNRRPRFTISIVDHTTGALLDPACGFFDVYPGDGTTGWLTQGTGNNQLQYKNWNTVGIDLSGMTAIGQTIDIVFNIHGCAFTAHTAYAYISATCGSMTVSLAGCEGSGQITFTAPPGFANYEWQGPYCPLCPTPPPIYTGQTVTITTAQGAVSGNVFVLNLTAANGCMVQNVQNIVGFTSVSAAFSSSVMCALNQSTFTDISVSSNPTQPVINRQWQVDGGAWSGLSANPVYNYTFLTPGPHTVAVQSFSLDGCMGTTSQVVNIDPAPAIINASTTKSICSGDVVALALDFSPGTDATWTSTVTSGTATITPNPASQSGTVINDVIVSTGAGSAFVTYTVTPHISGCNGTPVIFNVTVSQIPNVTFTYNTPSACSGVAMNIQLSSNVAGASFAWTATGSSGNVSPQFTSGTGNITLPFTNLGTAIENVVFSVVPSASGCSPVVPAVSNPVTIYPVPDLLTSPASLTVCSNSQASITLSSVVQNTTYAWTATGGAGITPTTVGGNGNIAETFQNSGAAPATVSIAIVPTANGCSHTGLAPYLLIVNPKPGVVFPASPASPQTICSGTSSATVNLLSTVTLPGITYAWSASAFDPVNPTTGVTGFTTPNLGNSIPGENLSSSLLGPGLVKYEVTATFSNGGATCPGDPSEYQVIVNPTPTLALSPADPAGQTICSGSSSAAVTFTPNVTPVTYAWQAVEVVGINPPVMNGITSSIPAQLLTVTGAAQGYVKYKVTPTFQGSGNFTCTGGDSYSTIFVNPLPAPAITSTSPQTICELQPGVAYSTPNVAGDAYTWNVTGGTVFNGSASAVTVDWGPYTASPGTLTVTEKINATGCQVTTPAFAVVLQQRPVPTLTGAQTVCDGASGSIYQTEPLMSNYAWTIAGGSFTSGGTAVSNTATVTWNTPGSQWIQVNYINGLGCPGFPAKHVTVTVNPSPVSTISEGTGTVCSLQDHTYNTPADPASTFTWSVIPAASGIIVSGQGTNFISVNWQTSGNATIAVTATKIATACATSSTYPVLVHPSPVTAFTACFDTHTTPLAQKFTLRGGTPWLPGQGVFSGNRVSFNAISGMYEFDPFGASVGNYPITYTYTNTFGCTVSSAPVSITVVNSAFTCNGDLTDVRDGKKYKTSLIGTKCWMRDNLAYGTVLDAAVPQTDNCIPEKYCLTADANCTAYGGLYQWDELMAYASTSAGQGICPPSWHIPTEAEWQAMIDAIAASAPPVDGYAGSFLKDAVMNPGFHALTSGFYYLNNTWGFTSGILNGTMFWTSTPNGTGRGVARGVNTINPSISKYPGSRGNAFSVRCVKD